MNEVNDVLTMQNVNNLVSTKESRAKVLSVMNENETKMFKRFVKSVVGLQCNKALGGIMTPLQVEKTIRHDIDGRFKRELSYDEKHREQRIKQMCFW